MHEALVNRLGGLSLPRKSMVRLTDHPDMTLEVYYGRKTTMQQQQKIHCFYVLALFVLVQCADTSDMSLFGGILFFFKSSDNID